MVKYVAAAALLGVLTSCGGNSVTGLPEEVEFAPQLGVDLATMQKTANGVYYKDLVVGTGAPVALGDNVQVAYSGWLVDGTLFEASNESCFPLVRGQLIEGWIEGLPGATIGSTRQLVIPPALAYGDQGVGDVIPPNATLVFEIDVLNTIASCDIP